MSKAFLVVDGAVQTVAVYSNREAAAAHVAGDLLYTAIRPEGAVHLEVHEEEILDQWSAD